MRCEVCGKVCEDSLMLARHVVHNSDHERLQGWANSTLSSLRSSLKASGESSARLTKAMADGWEDQQEEELFDSIRQSEAMTEEYINKRRMLG